MAMNLQLNGQPIQIGDLLVRLNIEDRINHVTQIQQSLDKDLETILSRTKRCARCYVCKKHFFACGYESLVVLLTAQKCCGHVFHSSCVADKLAANPECPICKSTPVFACNLMLDH